MLRYVYQWILRRHPDYFRLHFGEEMLSIYDLQKGTRARAWLIADGFYSLMRQWTLRPHFGAESEATPRVAGVPQFWESGRYTPRFGALVNGAFASMLIFSAICLAMGYSWEHPSLMPIDSYYRAPLQATQSSRGTLQQTPQKKVPPVYVDGGRVILMVQNPSR